MDSLRRGWILLSRVLGRRPDLVHAGPQALSQTKTPFTMISLVVSMLEAFFLRVLEATSKAEAHRFFFNETE